MFQRSKELERIIKFQRETIQDQAMRIEVRKAIFVIMYQYHTDALIWKPIKRIQQIAIDEQFTSVNSNKIANYSG